MQKMNRVIFFSLSLFFTGVLQAQEDFSRWLTEFKTEARQKGVSNEILDQAFEGVMPIPRIIELDRKQPESVLTLNQYVKRVVPKRRIKLGRKRLAENEMLLKEVATKYGVQERFLVAFWGIETDFGRHTGGYSVVAALATLAFDGRRSAFFRRQLFDALMILEEGHIAPKDMKGSWAGAMGQAQFIPSTFRAYAVDGDGDGKIDIWNSKADVFSSAANYLSKVGWNDDLTWGREVELPKNFDLSQASLDIKKPLGEWRRLGVRRLNDRDLPDRDIEASVIVPDEKPGSRAYLVYDNYRAILHWNRSHKFAVAVGTLSDHIAR